MNEYFVNEAFEIALVNYEKYKDHTNNVNYNSFIVVVVRSLMSIYTEKEILNAFHKKNEASLDNVLIKYGADVNIINDFKNTLSLYYIDSKNKKVPNKYINEVEKMIIDLYMLKKMTVDITLSKREEFLDLLYTPFSSSDIIISDNFLNNKDIYEIYNYFDRKDLATVKLSVDESKVLLTPSAYKVINKNYTDICLLTPSEILDINKSVYDALEVDEKASNFDYKFDEALFKFYHNNLNSVSNGFVNILLVIGIVLAIVFIAILGFIIFV